MPRTRQQYEELRREKMQHIMDAALEIFSTKGFHASTIADIAQKAGVAKGLIYNYFKSKEDLLYQIISRFFEAIVEKFDENNNGVLTSEEMRLYINDIFGKVVKNRSSWKLYFSVMLQPNVFSREIIEKLEHKYMPMVTMMIEYFRRAGYPNPEMEYQILHTISDGIVINYLVNENFPLEEIKNELLRRYFDQ